jgi:hypothetical protein
MGEICFAEVAVRPGLILSPGMAHRKRPRQPRSAKGERSAFPVLWLGQPGAGQRGGSVAPIRSAATILGEGK